MQFSPLAFDDFSQAVEISHWLFFPVVGCELNARTCKHDVTRFISFVPVWLFHFVCGSFTDAVHSESMYSGPTLSYVNRMK